MHPNRNSELYLDAYLNGLEVFKLILDKNLASPNSEPSSTTTPITPIIQKKQEKKTSYAMIIGGIGGVLVLFSIVVLIVFL
ncbi:putative non-specific serine/threonine protein kinase [Helianthus anomalus]